VAALVRHDASGWNVPVSHVAGHKEHQPGAKSDPTFNMTSFRAAVAREIKEWDEELPVDQTKFNNLMNGWAETDEGQRLIKNAVWTGRLSNDPDPATPAIALQRLYNWAEAEQQSPPSDPSVPPTDTE
jgi:hypothetical protein